MSSPKTATQYRNEIVDYFLKAGAPISKSRAMKEGIRMHRLNQYQERDFYESMRILGIISDPTPRNAITNIERQAS